MVDDNSKGLAALVVVRQPHMSATLSSADPELIHGNENSVNSTIFVCYSN